MSRRSERPLLAHSKAELAGATGRSYAGKQVSSFMEEYASQTSSPLLQ